MNTLCQGAVFAVGKRHNQMATTAHQAPGIQPTCAGRVDQAKNELKTIVSKAICLARRGTARLARQSRTMGPKRGCVNSHRSYLTLPSEKQYAASKTNGVVGNNGKTMPTAPVARLMAPQTSHTQRCQRGRGMTLLL